MAQGESSLCKASAGVSVTRTWNLVSRKHYKHAHTGKIIRNPLRFSVQSALAFRSPASLAQSRRKISFGLA